MQVGAYVIASQAHHSDVSDLFQVGAYVSLSQALHSDASGLLQVCADVSLSQALLTDVDVDLDSAVFTLVEIDFGYHPLTDHSVPDGTYQSPTPSLYDAMMRDEFDHDGSSHGPPSRPSPTPSLYDAMMRDDFGHDGISDGPPSRPSSDASLADLDAQADSAYIHSLTIAATEVDFNDFAGSFAEIF